MTEVGMKINENPTLLLQCSVFSEFLTATNLVENRKPGMATTEELQDIIAGLTSIVKQQADAQKVTNAQITQLTEALHTHGMPTTAPATSQLNSASLRKPSLQFLKFQYDHSRRCQLIPRDL